MRNVKLAAIVAMLCVLPREAVRPLQGASHGRILDILQTELERNYEVLREEPTPAYYIGYAVHDIHSTRIGASFGSVVRNDESHSRFGTVEVRVGDYELDNTHPIRGDVGAMGPRVTRIGLPLTDDEKPINLAFWRTTDRAFKQATEALTRVKTNVAAKVKEEQPAPDFSKESRQNFTGDRASYTIDTREWESRLRRISAPFAEDPLIFQSDVALTVDADNRYLVTSEGSRIATGHVHCRIFIQAVTKATDGMDLPLYASYFSRSLDGLPSEQKLIADVRDMMAMLARLRTAPLVNPYSGPAILSGRAAGVFFHEIFGHRVEGHRQKQADDGQTFGRRVNELVLPSFLSVAFDPTQRKVGNIDLMGHYQYDDEGVQARRVPIVDKGILRTFLLGRSPLPAFQKSNGHGRAEAGFVPVSRQSNLIVESSKRVTFDALLTMLKDEARRQGKPFGLLFENIEGGFTTTGRNNSNAFNVIPNVVYRVYTDNRAPELVRGVDLIGTPLAAFGKFLAAGDTPDVFNGVCGAESGSVPVSASSPPLLVSEVEVQKKAQSQEGLPILPAPAPQTRSVGNF
jgi:predicted Zn-dependent protease